MAYWRLREVATPQHWSALSLARETKQAYNTVWGIWSNRSKRADLETLQRIADVLGVSPGDLIGSGPGPTPHGKAAGSRTRPTTDTGG